MTTLQNGLGFFSKLSGMVPMTPEECQAKVLNPVDNLKMKTEKAAAIRPDPNQKAVDVLSECQRALAGIMSNNVKNNHKQADTEASADNPNKPRPF